MTTYMDYTNPSAQFFYDMKQSRLVSKDSNNFINVMGVQQLNTLDNTSLLDIYLSKSNIIEPHYHQNAAELVYCISGSAVVSILNPFTKALMNIPVNPGQVANVPQGWWHYEFATSDQTHLLAIFNAPQPEVILGSDILHFTPDKIMATTYCMDEEKWKAATHAVQPNLFIGPPSDCHVQRAVDGSMNRGYPAPSQSPSYEPTYAQVYPAFSYDAYRRFY
ncbi:cupin domain-containing protein [Alkalihalobacillus pseudalcaliphilus]|uniref:cupin domain-containing protein n=1 Tax=Alkalihalobacillus pseudalcaliphilus TaxID=79884 RepID=UPI00064DCF3C|nr:cupin domain-containing protein [Alkalihalobacillus pseudalcaliphilus]KMK78147.1 cupin [Alkalihalobacillus pseudalcaliphilus]